MEAESEDECTKSEPTKVKSKIGNLKPDHRDIIATQKTHAMVGTPLTGTTIVKSGPHEPTTPPKKKAQKNIAGIFIDWESHRKPTLSATSSIDADEDSMVKQGRMVSDDECDDAEHEAIAKGPTLPRAAHHAIHILTRSWYCLTVTVPVPLRVSATLQWYSIWYS